MNEWYVTGSGEIMKADYYALRERGVPEDWREATPTEVFLFLEVERLRNQLQSAVRRIDVLEGGY